ncbi:ATP-dependent RNA helicase SrmB [Vibrio cholerae]|uniref:ATP-dependent RNA helicase SrmB n=1 Tax=Vibrio cholerae TaxID=666 RepID=UPI001ED1DC66|nr:ATP-dependent RNA helicase SrmB [Vibrio cholerae]EGR3976725.1 ATP-dependent RNA helicase SrmB [Vibrio cholerae]ELN3181123.1 ATP-dependent RNA helicase SrmB [Vibrio cholerae]MDN6976928.1 ATP-dependent RNA helicase SrmB [Vibrio cholerae]HDZ9158881.1 ATP-dependent RNA helicase SrmB [Vibrio cholerae]
MIKTFANLELDPILLEAIEEMGFSRPTQVQAEAIPQALDGRDVLASAPTGTGKTAAFVIPALQYLLDFPRRKAGPARILILTPTRELAMQVAEQAQALAKNTRLNIFTITGGVQYQEHADILATTQDIVVATPGRLLEYIDAERFDCRAIEWLILDEADRMLDMGFGPTVDRLSTECRWRKQTLLFSATLEGRGVEGFTADLLKDPAHVDAEPPRRERKKISQWHHRADDMPHKVELLKKILTEQAERSIVFLKTRERLADLRAELEKAQIPCAWIQGEMPQDRRNNAISRFREGDVNILLATDVAARGIDVPDISHVINFDLPRSADVYLHRIGRTGRAGKKGIAISLVEAHDQPMMARVERYIKEEVKERFIDGLRPKHKKPVFKKKKKDSKKTADKGAVKKKTTSKPKAKATKKKAATKA